MNVRKASNLASVVLFGSILLNANADIINDFSNQELLDTQVETAKFQKQETYKENFKKETFKLGQACCFFNGIGKYPHLKIIDLYHGLLPELSKINL